MIQDNNLIDDFHALSPEKQAEVIDFIQRLKQKQNASSRKWSEIRGSAAAPLTGEDAQMWVSRQRLASERNKPPQP